MLELLTIVPLFEVNAVSYDVYSFDFDGCTANYLFLSSKVKDIIVANKILFDNIKSTSNQKIIYIGSNRQAPRDDLANSLADERGSCYPALEQIAVALGGVLDNFLLGDIYNNLPDGTCFNQTLKYLAKNNKDYKELSPKKFKSLYNWVHDESKLTVLYAQMHKVSLEHPDEPINFNFFDDREDILTQLHAYFLKHQDLIPSNVTLNLKQYRGPIDRNSQEIDPLVVDYPSIGGIRPGADKHYRQTVKTMVAVTIEKMTEKGMDISATGASKGITSYTEAKKYGFDISAIKCINHYEPGMMPMNPPDVPSAKKEKLFSEMRKLYVSKHSSIEKLDKLILEKKHFSEPTPSGFNSATSITPSPEAEKFKLLRAEKPKSERPKDGGLMGIHKSLHVQGITTDFTDMEEVENHSSDLKPSESSHNLIATLSSPEEKFKFFPAKKPEGELKKKEELMDTHKGHINSEYVEQEPTQGSPNKIF
ncbi:hypothetical protein DGG96_10735 [Legionella qingyii]|uniref:Dot/Icm T4SS effector n=1 Tax=Legionella qingyii TaxID=2184757 RepID=A0A317U526_9GAMM|nr:hypothetical protein [Legionella qingyii]PWY55582.1 hypothetical protein DGG96_10735 [Legionella qingyii]RUR21823.1 hypothetical protein ELY20_11435 [Legionella qingyii]RUR25249.1 hypothetical protein ELY16_09915 [Legionella qingyii]